jgi:sugar-phosphatase
VVNEVAALELQEGMTSEGIYEIEGARDLIVRLPMDQWAIVTSGTRAIASFRLNLVAIPIPPVMVCADEISQGKPHPEGYLTAASRLGFQPEECVVIEDTPPGIEAAHAGGMRVIAVAATYPREQLTAADAIVERLADLRVSVGAGLIQIAI